MKVFFGRLKETAGDEEAAELMALAKKLGPKLMMVLAQAQARAA